MVVGVTLPQAAPEQFAPVRVQVTFWAGTTVGVKVCEVPTSTVAVAGLIATVTTLRVNVVVRVTGTVAASTALTVMVWAPAAAAPVVLMVTVDVPVPGSVMVAGLKEQVMPVGAPGQEGVRVPV